jgi:hypothetical protein
MILRSGDSNDGYLKFNITGVSGTIRSAQLHLYSKYPEGYTLSAYEVSDTTWEESSLTWSNAPGLGTLIASSLVTTNWVSIDVTGHVVGNGLLSIGLSTDNGTKNRVHTKEGAEPPYLELEYDL